jgi:hypothetical protein
MNPFPESAAITDERVGWLRAGLVPDDEAEPVGQEPAQHVGAVHGGCRVRRVCLDIEPSVGQRLRDIDHFMLAHAVRTCDQLGDRLVRRGERTRREEVRTASCARIALVDVNIGEAQSAILRFCRDRLGGARQDHGQQQPAQQKTTSTSRYSLRHHGDHAIGLVGSEARRALVISSGTAVSIACTDIHGVGATV